MNDPTKSLFFCTKCLIVADIVGEFQHLSFLLRNTPTKHNRMWTKGCCTSKLVPMVMIILSSERTWSKCQFTNPCRRTHPLRSRRSCNPMLFLPMILSLFRKDLSETHMPVPKLSLRLQDMSLHERSQAILGPPIASAGIVRSSPMGFITWRVLPEWSNGLPLYLCVAIFSLALFHSYPDEVRDAKPQAMLKRIRASEPSHFSISIIRFLGHQTLQKQSWRACALVCVANFRFLVVNQLILSLLSQSQQPSLTPLCH